MKSVPLTVLTFVLIISYGTNALVKTDCDHDPSRNNDAVVRIHISSNNYASGVVIGQNRILTVLHAFPVNSHPVIEFTGFSSPATVIATHEGYDLALLEAYTGSTHPVALSETRLQPGDPVWVVGYTGIARQQKSEGEFIKRNHRGLLTSAPIEAGFSGGALFHCDNQQSELSGIIRSYVATPAKEGLKNSGRSRAIPVKAIRRFLEELGLELL